MATARAPRDAPVEGTTPTKRLFTVHEYHKMGEAGILTEDDRVELIEGEILVKLRKSENHFGHVNRFSHVFIHTFNDRTVVHIQNPVRLGLRNEPEPDITLLRFRDDFYTGKFPVHDDVLLLVEVAESSLSFDRNIKLPLYAKAGIQEYWIVDLIHGEILVHREPSKMRYRSIQSLKPGDTIAPLAFPDITLAVADLLG